MSKIGVLLNSKNLIVTVFPKSSVPGTAHFTPPSPVNSTLPRVPPGGVTDKQEAARIFLISEVEDIPLIPSLVYSTILEGILSNHIK